MAYKGVYYQMMKDREENPIKWEYKRLTTEELQKWIKQLYPKPPSRWRRIVNFIKRKCLLSIR